MPWSLSQREGKWCVIKDDDGSEAGCHVTRADAIKQQRALYANESRMAALYSELDEREQIETIPDEAIFPVEAKVNSELVKIEIGKENEALTASVLSQMERMSERQAATDQALIAALHAIGARDPVVNISSPDISVEAPNVTVEPPAITVEAPAVTIEAAKAPEVTIRPEINVQMPASQKTVTFERDPLTGQVSKAEVTEA